MMIPKLLPLFKLKKFTILLILDYVRRMPAQSENSKNATVPDQHSATVHTIPGQSENSKNVTVSASSHDTRTIQK